MPDDCTEPDREKCPRRCQDFCNKREQLRAKAFQVGNWVRTSVGWRGQIVGVRIVDGEAVFDVEHESGYPTNPFLFRELTKG